MEKIFYTDKHAFPSSSEALQAVFSQYFGIENAEIQRTKNGKPYLLDKYGLFFSVSHTKNLLFIGVSDAEIGIDAEALSRETDYSIVLRKFPLEEQAEILSNTDFLRHWTAKEAAIKYLGGTLAKDLKKLSFIRGKFHYCDQVLPTICEKELEDTLLSICAKRDFSNAEIIRL